MNYSVKSFVFIAIVHACFFVQITRTSLGPDKHFEIAYINCLIEAKDITECPYINNPHKEAIRLLRKNPAAAFTSLNKNYLDSSPFGKAIYYKNVYIARRILRLPIKPTQEQKNYFLKHAIISLLDIVPDLIKQYKTSIFSPKKNYAKTDSFFSNLLFVTTYSMREAKETITYTGKIITPKEKKLAIICLTHALSTARKILTPEQFFKFTRFGQSCPFYQELYSLLDPDYCSRVHACLITHGATCSASQKCLDTHKHLVPFSPMRYLEHDKKYMDML